MSTHAYALMPGGGRMYPRKYYQRYFHLSSHWLGYRTLKSKIIKTGFVALAALSHVKTFADNVEKIGLSVTAPTNSIYHFL
jgi:hypothetical protein